MILKIFTDTRNINHHTHTKFVELLTWPNTGEQEQLRGIDGATAKDDLFLRPDLLFAAILKIGDPHSTCSFKQDARRQRLGPDGEIGTAHHGMKIADGCAVPFSIADGSLKSADAFLCRAIGIIIA